MSILQNSNAISAPADTDLYTHLIPHSCSFLPSSTSANSSRLTKTFGTVDSSVHWTLNFWIKRSAIEGNNPVGGARLLNVFTPRSGTSGSVLHEFGFAATGSYGAGDSFVITNTNTGAYILSTNNLFRDTSAWYNIHIQADLDNGTASEKLKIFVNGTEASYNVDNRSSFSSMAGIAAGAWTIGDYYNYGYPIQSYIAQWAYVDGYTHPPTVFSEEKSGVWLPKDLTSGITWGSAGHLLMFQDGSNFGDDTSGEGNDYASHKIFRQFTDSPTNNFCTYNPLQEQGTAQKLMALSEGNLQAESTTNDKYHQIIGNMGVKTGKWYIEWYIKDAGYPSWSVGWHHGTSLGLFNGNGGLAAIGNMQYMGYFTGNNVYITNFGNTSTGDPQVAHASFTNQGAPTTGDVIMCAIDNDAGKCWWGINGVWGNIGSGTGNPATGANASATWTIANYTDYKFPFTLSWANPVAKIMMNTGSEGTFLGNITAGGNADDTGYGNFKYDVPAGFLSLCTGNLPTADAVDPAQTNDNYPQKLFAPKLYTGDGASTLTISGMDFKPDFTWIKARNDTSGNKLFDSTRGVTKYLASDSTALEVTASNTLKSWTSDGFTLGDESGVNYNSSTNYVAWNWRANVGTTSTNTQGDINSTVQVDPSGGFSVVQYTGTLSSSGVQTVGHGLSKAPSMFITKSITTVGNWWVFSDGQTSWNYGMNLNSTIASTDKSGNGSMSAPTSTVFSTNYTDGLNETNKAMIAYCFANTEGFIKSGSYVGNGESSDNAFVFLGFRPSFVLTKGVRLGDGWNIHDDATSPSNVADTVLQANTSGAELSNYNIDMLSNGFKVRGAGGDLGSSGVTYIYLAFAENPFKYATAR